jgi:hypothetical protein
LKTKVVHPPITERLKRKFKPWQVGAVVAAGYVVGCLFYPTALMIQLLAFLVAGIGFAGISVAFLSPVGWIYWEFAFVQALLDEDGDIGDLAKGAMILAAGCIILMLVGAAVAFPPELRTGFVGWFSDTPASNPWP